MARYLYSELSSLVDAYHRCVKSGNEYADKHMDMIKSLVKNHMPSGYGFDSGTKIDVDSSHGDKLVFATSFHHMDDNGHYCGWTEHTVTVTPSLAHKFNMRIGGRNRNGIKDYMLDIFHMSLTGDVEWDVMREYPAVKALSIEIKSAWLDESRIEYFVTRNGDRVFTAERNADTIGQCKDFAVKLAKGLL